MSSLPYVEVAMILNACSQTGWKYILWIGWCFAGRGATSTRHFDICVVSRCRAELELYHVI